MKDLTYKCHVLAINELPNFKNPEDKLYRGTTIIDGKKWEKDGSAVYLIDNLYRGRTYDDVYKQWGRTRVKRFTYKGKELKILLFSKGKESRPFYVGEYTKNSYWDRRSIESISYDKVLSKFQRFVDEYCTDWVSFNSLSYIYRQYELDIKKDSKSNSFFGTCQIHKNSTFKCISSSIDEIRDKFRARIDRIIEEKENVKMNTISSKQEKIQELEQAIAKLSSQLEELKKEKEIYIYKGVTLEYGKEEGLEEGYIIGRIKNAPKGTREFYRKVAANIQTDFEEYIDELEELTNIYLELTGQEIYIPEKHDY